jgi:membrane-bound inhibitor of C-type lysozyme
MNILQKFGMMDCKSMDTPMTTDIRKVRDSDSDPVDPSLYRKLIGSLMYLVNTRPYICFAINTLSQFQVEPKHENWIVTKHVLRYICGTLNYGLRYTSSGDIQLHGFTDSGWVGSAEDKRSTSGMSFSLGSAMISWVPNTQCFMNG